MNNLSESLTEGPPRVERLAVREIQPKRQTQVQEPQQQAAEEIPPDVSKQAVLAAIQGTLRAVALVLSLRLLLLLSLIGAFVLGYIAMQLQTWAALSIFVAYSMLTVIPLVALAWPTKSRSG